MPELPDLEVVGVFLRGAVCGEQIRKVQVLEPLVLRCRVEELIQGLEMRSIDGIRRRGKFLILDLPGSGHLIFNFMLTGRLQHCSSEAKTRKELCLKLEFSAGRELRYLDRKRMGRIYWITGEDFSGIPQFAELGPEATDPKMDLEAFCKRIRRHPGMIKNILTNQRFLAGIGNAYADEILFQAGILPFRRRTSLSPEELARLHNAIGSVLAWAVEELIGRVGVTIHEEVRDFLRVHGKGGQACPLCGGKISEVAPNRRRTNFCRECQS